MEVSKVTKKPSLVSMLFYCPTLKRNVAVGRKAVSMDVTDERIQYDDSSWHKVEVAFQCKCGTRHTVVLSEAW